MKNNCFSKVPLLVMSLLVISSGQALSLSSNNKDLSHGDGLGKAQLVIAQDNIGGGVAVSVVVKALDTVIVKTQSIAKLVPVNIPPQFRDVVLSKLQQSIGSFASAKSSAQKGDNVEVAQAVSQAVTFLGQAVASASADTGTVKAITSVIADSKQVIATAQGTGSSKP